MRRSTSKYVAVAAVVLLALLVVPQAELALAKTTSCFAFIGMRPDSKVIGRPPREAWFRPIREATFASGALRRPMGPYVLVAQIGGGRDDIVLASRTGTRWDVEGANLVFDKTSPAPQAFPDAGRRLSAEQVRGLETLTAKRCLYKEPQAIRFAPQVWLGFYSDGPAYYDGGERLVEVSDGEQTRLFSQGDMAYGISGALGALLTK